MNLHRVFVPLGGLLSDASAMKLGGFSKVPELIKRAKRHLNRTNSSEITR